MAVNLTIAKDDNLCTVHAIYFLVYASLPVRFSFPFQLGRYVTS